MGGSACHTCCREASIKEKLHVPVMSKPSPQGGKNKISGVLHEGQHRANLEVKAGGFALKNFACSNPGKIEDFYDVDKRIGEGAFGTVRKAMCKHTKIKRAVKSIQKSATQEMKKLKEEIEIIRLLDHPNIVRLFESFEDRKTVYLVLELCDGGELFERIVQAGTFTENVAAFCVRQMLLAINYLHQNLIIHRDLKPENWLVVSSDAVEKSTLKLIDFGISKRLKPGEWASTKAGTPNYVAPEVFSGRYNEKVDVWSSGVIAYIMLCGSQPFTGKNAPEILKAVKNGKVSMEEKPWRKISSEAKGLVKCLLQKDIRVRPSSAQALAHVWLAEAHGDVTAGAQEVSLIEVDQLRAFSHMNKMKKAVLTIMATNLTDERIESMRAMFMGMDKNSDGTISILELKEGLRLAGVKIPRDLQKIIEAVDTDGSGVLDYTEFLAATMDKKVYDQEAVVWQAFSKFDIDGSGAISIKELRKVLGDDQVCDNLHMSGHQDRVMELFKQVDTNGNGLIEFDEFLAMVRAHEEETREDRIRSGKDMRWPTVVGRNSDAPESARNQASGRNQLSARKMFATNGDKVQKTLSTGSKSPRGRSPAGSARGVQGRDASRSPDGLSARRPRENGAIDGRTSNRMSPKAKNAGDTSARKNERQSTQSTRSEAAAV